MSSFRMKLLSRSILSLFPEYVTAPAQGSTNHEITLCAIIVNGAGRLAIHSEEGVKLIATVLYYQH